MHDGISKKTHAWIYTPLSLNLCLSLIYCYPLNHTSLHFSLDHVAHPMRFFLSCFIVGAGGNFLLKHVCCLVLNSDDCRALLRWTTTISLPRPPRLGYRSELRGEAPTEQERSSAHLFGGGVFSSRDLHQG